MNMRTGRDNKFLRTVSVFAARDATESGSIVRELRMCSSGSYWATGSAPRACRCVGAGVMEDSPSLADDVHGSSRESLVSGHGVRSTREYAPSIHMVPAQPLLEFRSDDPWEQSHWCVLALMLDFGSVLPSKVLRLPTHTQDVCGMMSRLD